MQKTCPQCLAQFEITQDDLAFYSKVSPVFNGVKYQIPEPTLCPDCRQQRRLSWRNERKIYKRKCDSSKKEILSMYSVESPFTVYEYTEWKKDFWNSLNYGKEFDFSKTCFDQFKELIHKVPKRALSLDETMENCEYSNYGAQSKNCFLCTTPVKSESCMYSTTPAWCVSDVDGYNNIACQYCYECIHCANCYETMFSRFSSNCRNTYFLLDCIDCEYCFACIGMRHKKYCIFNEQYSEEEYFFKITTIIQSYELIRGVLEKFQSFILQFPHNYAHNIQVENCSGDILRNCKDCFESYDIINAEKIKFVSVGGQQMFDVYDSHLIGFGANLCYENIGSESNSQVLFSAVMAKNSNCLYCVNSQHCENCFACDGLWHKKYCILNKQYTKEEYEKLVPQIIEHMKRTGEWGEFFPVQLSPFAYNETVAQECFPLTKEQVLARGWKWKDKTDEIPQVSKIIPGERLPGSIKDIPDDVLNWAIKCEVTGRPFKIQKAELAFYRKMNLPIPRKHPDQRHKERLALRNPRKLWHRNCGSCGKGIQTTYAPDRPEKVFCEECYLKAVY